jgi:hypothetical protein
MLAVWYPTVLLHGLRGPLDPYFVILMTVLAVLALARIVEGFSSWPRGPHTPKSRR